MTIYLTLPEAAEQLGCSVSTVRNRVRAGHLQAHRLPGTKRLLVRAVDLAVLLEPAPVAS